MQKLLQSVAAVELILSKFYLGNLGTIPSSRRLA